MCVYLSRWTCPGVELYRGVLAPLVVDTAADDRPIAHVDVRDVTWDDTTRHD